MDTDFILDRMQIDAAPFALCELNGRCDLGLGQDSTATLHYVLAGEGEIVIPGQKTLPVARGSVVVIPALRSHVLRSFGTRVQPVPECQPAGLNLVHLVHGSAAQSPEGGMVALCAHITLSLRDLGNVVDLVREPIVDDVIRNPDLAAPVEQILSEIAEPKLGSRAMIRALLLQAMIGLMRHHMEQAGAGMSWMMALRDARLWPVLAAMLERPGQEHSLDSLATLSGMSRSSLAQRFADAYGAGPMELLRDLRMQKAADLLRNSEMPVKRISAEVGFQSRTAFSRAFVAATGQSPRSFRSQSQD
ncbi:AraC family transcriptional regulator [Aliisedimentitalea scapharcae]|uniref:AraC family transcriptional regulator n=1 Tax=Aliisedimentitalea scapharcae TaxID=1524259 RepID=A0ABZ2XR78_9RHOB